MKYAKTLIDAALKAERELQAGQVGNCDWYLARLAEKNTALRAFLARHEREVAELNTNLTQLHVDAETCRERIADFEQALQAIAKETA